MQFGIHSLLFAETFLDKNLPSSTSAKPWASTPSRSFPSIRTASPPPKSAPPPPTSDSPSTPATACRNNTTSSHPDPAIRQAGIDFSKKLIDLSNEAGAKVFGGMIYCGWGYLTGKMRTADEWRWGVDSYREIAAYAQQNSDLILGIEPVNRFESHFINTAADALRFIGEVGLPNVKVHLDTFHMIREEDDFAGAVLAAGSQLGYVHACENQRGIPGSGLVPWQSFFQALDTIGYDGCITIESFDPNMESIAKLCCIWRKLADSPEQLATEGLRFLRQVHAGIHIHQ